MFLNKRVIQVTVFIVTIILGIFYNDKSANSDLKENFSPKFLEWFNQGKYFLYKGVHNIFYVHEYFENYKLDSNEDLPSLVLLHGFPTSSYDYQKVWKLLGNNQNKFKSILTFDYLGYGFSDKPNDYEYSIFDMADMVDMLLMHLDIRSIYLVAHDISDSVAQEIIRRDNIKNQNHFSLEKVVLLNGGIMQEIYKPLFSQQILRTNYFKNIFAKYFFRFSIFKFSFKKVFGELSPPNERDLYDFYLGIKYNFGNEKLPLTIEYLNERTQYGDVWYDALNETSIPIMFIYGPADPINPRDKFPQLLRIDLPKVKLTVLSDLVGHYPQYEDPFTTSELIKKFFN